MSKPKATAAEEKSSSSDSDDDSSTSSSSGEESGTRSNVTHTATSASGTTGSGSGTTTTSGSGSTTGTSSTSAPAAPAKPLKSLQPPSAVSTSAVVVSSLALQPPPRNPPAPSTVASNAATGPTSTPASKGKQPEVKDVSSSSEEDSSSDDESATTTTTTTNTSGTTSGTTTGTTTTSGSGTTGTTSSGDSKDKPNTSTVVVAAGGPKATSPMAVAASAPWKGANPANPVPPRGPPVVAIVAPPLPSPVKPHVEDVSVEGTDSSTDDTSTSSDTDDESQSGSTTTSGTSGTTANSSDPTGGTTTTTTTSGTTTTTTTTTTTDKKHRKSSSSSSDSQHGKSGKILSGSMRPAAAGPPPPIPLAPKPPAVSVLTQNVPPGQQFPIGHKTPESAPMSGQSQGPSTSQPNNTMRTEGSGGRYPESGENGDSDTSSVSESTSSSSVITASSSDQGVAPTKQIRIVRDRRSISVQGQEQQQSPLPVEFATFSFLPRDTLWAVISAVYETQTADQQKFIKEHPEQQIDPAPANHLTLGNAQLVLRSMGFPDDQSARMLAPFRAMPTVSAHTLHAAVLKEGVLLVARTVTDIFAKSDKGNCGETRLQDTLDAVVECGVCDATPCPALSIRAAIENRRLFAKVTTHYQAPPADSSSPPPLPAQDTVSLLEITPQTLQLSVDTSRGEVLCNGVPMCTGISDLDNLRSVVQAIQCCAYVSSLVSACTFVNGGGGGGAGDMVDYTKLVMALLASPSSAIDNPAAPSRSILFENIWNRLFAPMDRLTVFKNSRLVEPFLATTMKTASDRRRLMLPTPNATFTDFDRRDPQWNSLPESTCIRLFISEIELPGNIVVPATSQRYILLSTVAGDNTVLPAIRINAKAVKPGANPGFFLFSRKKVSAAALVSGSKSDILYVEACFEEMDSKTKLVRQQCAGFATISLGRAATGSLTLRPGTFYGRLTRPADEEDADSVKSGGCFCFGSKPPSRVQIELTEIPSIQSSISETFPARFACFARHMDLLTLFRDSLCDRIRQTNSKAMHALQVVRDNMTVASLFVLEQAEVLDHLAEAWAEAKGRIPRDRREDPSVVRDHFLHFLVRAKAVTELVHDLSRWRLVMNGVQLLSVEVTKNPVPATVI